MNIVNGFASCFLCGEAFDLGHHYDYHMALCREKKRIYVRMDKEAKRIIVERVEAAMDAYCPGFLIKGASNV
jgi:hypothetical protein